MNWLSDYPKQICLIALQNSLDMGNNITISNNSYLLCKLD